MIALLPPLLAYSALVLAAGAFGGPEGAFSGSFLVALLLPATLLAVGRRYRTLARGLASGLLPGTLRRAARAGRGGYPLVGITVLLLGGGTTLLLDRLQGQLPAEFFLPASLFLVAYTCLVIFRMTGSLAGRHQEVLGSALSPQPKVRRRARSDSAPTTQERIRTLLREKRLGEAAELLRQEVVTRPTDPNRWEQYYRILQLSGEREPLIAASRAFLTVLLRAGNPRRAVEVAHNGLDLDPEFRPANPDQILPLARAARRCGRPRLALRLMDRFAHHYPNHPGFPGVILLSAKILWADLDRKDQAQSLLRSLARRFPQHPAGVAAHRLIAPRSRAM